MNSVSICTDPLLRCGTDFDKICQIDLNPDLVENRWHAAFIVACKLGLTVWLGFFKLCVHIVLFLTFVRYQKTSVSKTVLSNPTTYDN